ncbi:type II secretion system F family protein [Candidatus Parcubacteria bacterium]|nr:type II secretion system F family protein [Candidatus Parcubacteria bacterium]
MAKFNYKARNKEGKLEAGIIEASSKDAAAVLLQKYKMFVTSLEEVVETTPLSQILNWDSGLSKKELAIFSRQLAVMLQSRVPVIQSLESLSSQTRKPNFRKIILDVANLVEEGIPLSEAFARHSRVFDNFYVSLVKSGEISGKISETLYYISDHLEREHDIIAQVRQALVYPIFTLSVLFVVINIVIIFLLPKIQDLIRESNTAPDAFTLFTLDFYSFLGTWWWVVLLVFMALVIGVIFYLRTGPRCGDLH